MNSATDGSYTKYSGVERVRYSRDAYERFFHSLMSSAADDSLTNLTQSEYNIYNTSADTASSSFHLTAAPGYRSFDFAMCDMNKDLKKVSLSFSYPIPQPI